VASQSDAQLEGILANLEAGEFIYEQPATSGTEYVFKHALTQEVAYNSLLIERRKQLHEGTGQALEAIFASQLDDHLTQLAHHYSLSDNVDKAVEYLGRAGQQALQRSAHVDAVSSLSAAIDLLERLPEGSDRVRRELVLQLVLGQASIVLKGWAAQEVERAFTRALEICAQLGDPPEVFSALMGLWAMYHVRGLYRPAREQAHELLRRAQSTNNPTLLIMAHYAVGETSLHTGELLLARKHQRSLLSLYDRERDATLALLIGADPKQSALSYAGWTEWFLGYPDQAVESGSEAILAAQAVSHPNSLAAAEFFSTIVRILRREPLIVLENAERVFAFSVEHGLGAWLLFASLHRGWAMTQLGRYEEGIEQIRQIATTAHAAGADIGRTNTLRWLAEGYAANGRIDEALATIAEALTAVEVQEERLYEPEIHLLKGELLLRQFSSNAAEAQSCFEYSIQIARNQSAKSSELRTTTSLARLLASQGRRDEARTMLAAIYNWFTEGFDTADLIDAKTLLEQLSN
jgi:predicted ATPase